MFFMFFRDFYTYMSLFEAVRSKDLNFLKDFIGEGRRGINESNEEGVTCLHIAAGLDDKSFLEFLLKHGAHVDCQTLDGLTPLHVAAMWGRSDNVDMLLNYGANPHLKDKMGYDAHFHALESMQEGSELIVNNLASMSLNNVVNTAGSSKVDSFNDNSELFATACCSPELNETSNTKIDFDKLNGSPWITPRKKNRKDKMKNLPTLKMNCIKEIPAKMFCKEDLAAADPILSNDLMDASLVSAQEKKDVVKTSKERSFPSVCSNGQDLSSFTCKDVSDSNSLDRNKCSPIKHDIDKPSSNFKVYDEFLTEMSLDLLSSSGNSVDSGSPTFSYSTITCLELQKYASQNDILLNLAPSCSSTLLTECSSYYDEDDLKELKKQENKEQKDIDQVEKERWRGRKFRVEREREGGKEEGEEEEEGTREKEEEEGTTEKEEEEIKEEEEAEKQEEKIEEEEEERQEIIKEGKEEREEVKIFGFKNNAEKTIRRRDNPSNIPLNSTFTIAKSSDINTKKSCNLFIPIQSNVPFSGAHPIGTVPTSGTPFSNCLPDVRKAEETIIYDWKDCSKIDNSIHESIHIPESFQCLTTEELKKRIISHGETPGPITSHTKTLYLKKLWKLEQGFGVKRPKDHSPFSRYPPEARMVLTSRSGIPEYSSLEEEMMREFGQSSKKTPWRGGNEKSSFNYLLLDPRVSCNLPGRFQTLSETEAFRCFVLSVFYVGKGKRSRPYAHLHEAMRCAKNNKTNKKVAQIWDIWGAGLGVISLHIFQSAIQAEAFTREACMIDALGLSQLTNQKRGEHYGLCASLPLRRKRNLGIFFLHKALQIFLNEGERQICKEDL